MKNKINILLVEDEESHADLISLSFESTTVPVSLTLTRNLNEARISIAESVPDLIIADYILQDGKGTELLPVNKENHPYPIVIMTSHGDERIAVETIKAGAFDYIVKSEAVLNDMPNICEKILLEWNFTIRHERIEKELKEGDARFQSVLSSLYESAVVIYDRDGKITAYWGALEMQKRYGICAIDTIGRSINEFVLPEQAEQRLADIRRVFNAGEKMLVEYMVVLPGGSFWQETSLSPMRDANGNITAVVGFIRDITERRQAEEALKESEERYRSLVGTTNTIPWEFDISTGCFTFIGAYASPLFGYPIDEWLKEDFWKDHIHPDDREETINLSMEFTKRSEDHMLEYRMMAADKSIVWIYDVVKVIVDSDGQKLLRGIMINITERKRVENVLRLTQFSVDHTLDATFWIGSDARIINVNESACKALGYSKEELLRLAVSDIDPNFPAEVWPEHWEDLKRQGSLILESCHRTKEGRVFPVEISLKHIEFDGMEYDFAFARDITERKRMEEALLHSEKLKSLGTITAGVAHEFNNILAIIIGSAEVLEGGFKDDGELKKGLNAIIKASDDGTEIVKRMLSFAKEELDISNYIFIDIWCLIQQAIDFTMPRWKNMAQSKGINYQISTIDITETPEAFCSPIELREVFVNLINNALDAMPDGGIISFSTESDENTIFVSISDTGKGISEDVKKKIFDPFFTTRRPKGTGLGMSVTYSIIKRHGGKIEVESEEGKGTAFNLSIPIHNEIVQRVVPSKPAREIRIKKLRILVIDDEDEICRIINKYFSKRGHAIKTVNNGVAVIELIRKEVFDLVLCDLAMPEITGYDVINALNGLDKRPKIGIVTGWSEKLKLLEENSLKVDFVIRKPFNLLELERNISDLGII